MTISTGITGVSSGISVGINGHLLSGLASIDSGARLINAMGFANEPDWMVKGNNASGMTDLIGSDNFSAIGTPNHQTVSSFFDDTTLEIDSNGDGAQAASSTPLDVGAESFAVLLVTDIYSWNLGTALYLFGKRESAGNVYGWEIITNTTQFRYTLKTTGGETFRTVANTSSGAFVLLGYHDYNAGNYQLCTNIGSSATGSTIAAATSTNSVIASIGTGRLNPVAARHAMAAVWTGSAAEGMTSANCDNLTSYLGL